MADEEDIKKEPTSVSDLTPTAASQSANLDETLSTALSQTSEAPTIPSEWADATVSDGGSATEVQRTSQTSSPSIQRSIQKSSASVQRSKKSIPSIQSGTGIEDASDKLSRSQEGSKKSQEFQLNGKKSSLDQLDRDKSSDAQKSRTNRMHRQCQRGIRELIGKREIKNDELEKQHGDLRQRLNILECSMPAVMVWNIWRMTQGGSVPSLQRVLEKQFQGPASGEIYCPSTPSRHFDCRVREVEADRKQAQKRVEEARTLWAEKMAVLKEREQKLEEAKRMQEEKKEKIQQLTIEAQKLREAASAAEDDGTCETGECGIIECKKKWLEKLPSNASIKSTDLECLEKLQDLAETELCMKRQIADLERREEAYMRTLQQADELWSKIEGDAASTMSGLQEQLDMKTSANQQMADRICQLEDDLEKMRARLVTCRGELEKYMSIEKIEALIGRDDDFAEVFDQYSEAGISMRHKMAGSVDDLAGVHERGLLARPDSSDVGIGVRPYTHDKAGLTKEEMAEMGILAKPDVDHMMLGIHPEDFAREQQTLDLARDYLARLGSLSALDGDDDYICPPDFSCNDQVFTESGLTEEEMTALKEKRVTPQMLLDAMSPVKEEVRKTVEVVEPIKVEETISAVKEDVSVTQAVSQKLSDIVSKETMEIEQELDVRTYAEMQSFVKTERMDSMEDEIEEGKMLESVVVKTEPPDVKSEPDEETVSEVPSDVDKPRTTSDATQMAYDTDTILVPRNVMLNWKNDVDSIRATIAKCSDCIIVKKEADDVAEGIAQYTGTELKEVEDISRKEEVEVAKEIAPEKAAEIEATVAPEERAKPEIEEAEVTADEVIMEVKKEEVPLAAEVVTAAASKVEFTEVKEVKDKEKGEYPPEVSAAQPVEDVSKKVDERVIPEMTREPEEMKIPTEAMVKETPIKREEDREEEEPAIKIKEEPVLREVKEAGAEEVVDVKVEALPAEREEPRVREAAAPARAEEMEVKEEVSPKIEDKEEAIEETLPPEEEKVVEVEVEVEAKEEVLPLAEGEEEIDVEVLPQEEEVDIEEKEEIPEEDEARVIEVVPEEELEVEADVLPVTEEAAVVEGVPEEEIEIEVDVLAEKEDIEAVPGEEVEIDVEVLPAEEEIAIEEKEYVPEEEELEVEVEVEEVEGLEKIPEEVAEEVELEVDVEVLPEEMEEPVLPPELEGIPSEKEVEEEVPPRKPDEFMFFPSDEHLPSCMCMSAVPSEPSKKIEVTQTEISQLELTTCTTFQGITQTATDVSIQTQPSQRMYRAHPPKYITITRTVDPEPEILQRLSRWRCSKERATTTTTTIASQTEKPSQTRTLPFSGTEVQSKLDAEHELRSIHYGAKAGQAGPPQCNCCMCGKTVSGSGLGPKTAPEAQPPSILRLLSALPMLSKLRCPAVDQEVQHDTFCPECKMRRLQEALKTQDPLKEPKQVVRKPMRDQETDASSSICCGSSFSTKMKQKSDQSCMVKISRLKVERTLRKDCTVDTVSEEKDVQGTTSTKGESEDSVKCVCTETIETGKPGVSKRVRCACGDPD